jgi:type I restriction enzyme, R subunit
VSHFNESVIEDAALDWLHKIGYNVLYGEDIAPGEPAAERANYSEVRVGVVSENVADE